MPDDPLAAVDLPGRFQVFVGLLVMGSLLGSSLKFLSHLNDAGIHQGFDVVVNCPGGLVQDKLDPVRRRLEGGAILFPAGAAQLEHGVDRLGVRPGKTDAHGPFGTAGGCHMELVTAVTFQPAKTHHQLLRRITRERPFDLAGGFGRITNVHALGTEVGNLARQRITGPDIKLGCEFDGLSGAAATFFGFHGHPGRLPVRRRWLAMHLLSDRASVSS